MLRGSTRTVLFRLTVIVATVTAAIGITGAAILVNPYDTVTGFLDLREPAVEVPGGDPELGKRAVVAHGCIACHQIPGVPQAVGWVGPPLNAWGDRRFIAGTLPNQPEHLIRWIMNPQAIEPGTAMPDLDVSAEDARHIAAYLYRLQEREYPAIDPGGES